MDTRRAANYFVKISCKSCRSLAATLPKAHWSLAKISPKPRQSHRKTFYEACGQLFSRKTNRSYMFSFIRVFATCPYGDRYLELLLMDEVMFRCNSLRRDKYSNSTEKFKWSKNREDSSFVDENLTESIAAQKTFIWKSFPPHSASKKMVSNFCSHELLFEYLSISFKCMSTNVKEHTVAAPSRWL